MAIALAVSPAARTPRLRVPWYQHWTARYGVSLAALAAIIFVRVLLDPILRGHTPFVLFTVPVVFAAFYGGLVPGLLITFLSAIIDSLLWIPPIGQLVIGPPHEVVHVFVFLCVGIALSIMGDSMRRNRAAAHAASHAKDEFLAVLSHELRTPLTPALLTLDMLAADTGLPRQVREKIMIADSNLQLLSRLMDDLLDANRIARNKLQLHREICDVHGIVARAVRICEADFGAKELNLSVDLTAQQHWVDADPTRLQQVTWNLLRNASKFTPHGGSVEIRTLNDGPDIVVTVTDNGAGIRPEDLSRILRPFEQGVQHTTPRYGGLGLGLAICKSLVTMHGGELSVRSAGVGQGATFTIRLPTSAPPAARTPAAPVPQRAWQPLRLLLVEDHPDTARVMARLLEHAGHHVIIAGTVRDALAAADHQTFDLLICDRALPDGSGLDIMRTLRPTGLIGLCLSGYGSPADRAASRQAGFAEHLTKPVRPEQLLSTIAALASAPATV